MKGNMYVHRWSGKANYVPYNYELVAILIMTLVPNEVFAIKTWKGLYNST